MLQFKGAHYKDQKLFSETTKWYTRSAMTVQFFVSNVMGAHAQDIYAVTAGSLSPSYQCLGPLYVSAV